MAKPPACATGMVPGAIPETSRKQNVTIHWTSVLEPERSVRLERLPFWVCPHGPGKK
ncbi:MAG: hypothetical protein MI753_07090 [Hyphomicrobiales bacterium]|nr:hypothetical protein [Hyphomicrobiales bacterium]